MSNEPSTIVYRCDFVRQGEQQKTKKERHAIYESKTRSREVAVLRRMMFEVGFV